MNKTFFLKRSVFGVDEQSMLKYKIYIMTMSVLKILNFSIYKSGMFTRCDPDEDETETFHSLNLKDR